MRGITLQLCIGLALIMSGCKKDIELEDELPEDINARVETNAPVLTAATININDLVPGYYVSQPANYGATSKNYPLIVFIPGAGQFGNGGADLALLLNDGVAKVVNEKKLPPNFSVRGVNYSFITATPQLKSHPTVESILSFLTYIRKNFRVDSNRIYLAGLSIGGTISSTIAAQYPARITAVLPMSGQDFNYNICKALADAKMPVWAFHNDQDPTIPSSQAVEFINRINSYQPALAPKLTMFKAFGHDSWTQALSPDYKENNMNIYEWMLQYSK